ncbi:N-acylneuraminate cytidylyltransferase [Cytobacillus eiseniae]|uniref:N-acylneuraminate cytidylyltransferase n=1 Tax=Cytobacillus eiseniae TaxID=762947 RepID=A0ABS4RGG5_9BACI|nr:acylneuraminate cytidylyltransferase family protein [Cytobacillus eiseniae]MBP2241993.1 N-acylneuraminate cytidylyltransferase [Cytobacillus eiseniae]
MIQDKKVLAIIPARGGSKGVPRKNIRSLAGKPLIAWTIDEAKKSKYIDRLILSSEDEEIIEIAKYYGCEVPFVRPSNLAEDTTPGIDPVIHALSILPNYEYVVVLQPTSPLRSAEDIDGSIEQLLVSGTPACVSVTEPGKSPYWMYTLQDNNILKPLIYNEEAIVRRQELPITYALNGAIYVAETKWLNESRTFLSNDTTAYIMPRNRSYDIDTEEDFMFCEWIKNK